MTLPLSSAHASRLELLEECGSTNAELLARAADAWPDFSVVVTTNQTAGRGRLGRVWVAPPGQSLAVSVLLWPGFPLEHFGWLPLLAGLAMTRAVETVLAFPETVLAFPETRQQPSRKVEVGLKWPNDVQVDGLKVSGLLAELLPGADGVVVGAGLNLSIPEAELPTQNSTSLILNGAQADDLLDRALASYLGELKLGYAALQKHGGDAEASGIRHLVEERCNTIGQRIRVELPDGSSVYGRATGIDSTGRLTFTSDADASVQAVAAGDVTHLRYE